MVLGAVLLVAALSLFLCNQHEAQQAEQAADALMPLLVEQIRENAATESESTQPSTLPQVLPDAVIDATNVEMTEVVIEGHPYIGYLSIPKLDLDLPVMSQRDYARLKIAPCRYTGSVMGEDLVIMAHNYSRHFGRLSDLSEGDSVYFMDMTGHHTAYHVVGLDILPPNAVAEMTSGEFDLTLFTCTFGGANRVTVYCDKE